MELIFTLLTGPRSGHMIRAKGKRLMMGRGVGCKIRIPSAMVSRFHCLITWDESGRVYRIEDSGSTNGTFLNGVSVTDPTFLLPGDDLHLGNIGFRVHYLLRSKELKLYATERAGTVIPGPGASPAVTIGVEDQLAEVMEAIPVDLPATDPTFQDVGSLEDSDPELATEIVELPQPGTKLPPPPPPPASKK